MKKLFTLAAASVLAATSLGAQAQVTLDGQLTAPEITAGNYTLIGKFTNPRGFGDYGLMSLYAASTPTKVYFFIGGTVQNNGNAFQLFLDLPGAAGVPVGTALPGGSATTSFQNFTAKLDLAADLALALRSEGTDFQIEGAAYTSATAGTSKKLSGAVVAGNGTPQTLDAAATTGAGFASLAGTRVAYKTTTDGKILTNPGNTPLVPATYGGVGSFGWEIEIDRTAAGLTGTPSIGVFVLQNNDNGGYPSSDFIPQTSAPLTTNSGNLATGAFDFSTLPGTQAATISVSATGVTLATRSEVAKALGFGVYPNPGSAVAVTYTVPQGKQAVALNVYDATGKQVRSFSESQAGAQSYNLSGLSAGIYVVKLNVGGAQTSSKVVID